MPPLRLPKRSRSYAYAILAAAIAVGFSLFLTYAFGVRLPLLCGICAVMVSAALGGAGPGLLAAAASMAFEFGLARLTGADASPMLRAPILITVLLLDIGVAIAGEGMHHLRRQGEARARRFREQEALLRSIFNALPAAMLVVDDQTGIRVASVEAGRLFDYDAIDLVGMQVRDLIPVETDAAAPGGDAADDVISNGNGVSVGRRRDGQLIMLRLAQASTDTSAGRLTTIMARDVTNEQADVRRIQELQDELIHMDRFTALGEMGTAIAHELNQPLSAAANYLAAARRMLARPGGEVGDGVIGALDEAGEEVLRAGTVLRRLRSFVSRSGSEQREVQVRDLVMEAALLSRLPVRDTRAEMKVDIEPDIGSCHVDKVQIQQVILNLVRNATEAMATSDVRRVTVSAKAIGGEVVISVQDTGPGISAAFAARLFKPFNTSKADGMGVGLAISRNIIEAHGGRIWLEPNSAGADFRFALPRKPSRESSSGG